MFLLSDFQKFWQLEGHSEGDGFCTVLGSSVNGFHFAFYIRWSEVFCLSHIK